MENIKNFDEFFLNESFKNKKEASALLDKLNGVVKGNIPPGPIWFTMKEDSDGFHVYHQPTRTHSEGKKGGEVHSYEDGMKMKKKYDSEKDKNKK